MADDAHGGGRRRRRRGRAAPDEPPFTFLDMPCDLLTCLGPVASTPGYEREVDGTQRLCRTARDDAMLGAATADLRYKDRWGSFITCKHSRLMYACRVNDHARVAWLVECGARDVLAAAVPCYKGGAALVRRMAADPLVDATEALVAAAHVGVAELVAPLVARGAQLDCAVLALSGSRTALQVASETGQLAMVAALLAAGADLDATNNRGRTALAFAAMHEHMDIAEALVNAGADVNQHDGLSAATIAAYEGAVDVPDYLCRLPQAEPSAHIAAAVWLDDVELVRGFIARGANVEETDCDGSTCLMVAARDGDIEVVRALLEAGADVAPATEDQRFTVLSSGVKHPAALALLLERFEVGGNAERQEQLNRALFHAAASRPSEGAESTRLLLAAGADANARVSSEHGEVHIMCIEEDDISMLSGAVLTGNVAAFRLLLRAGADVAGLDREATPEEEVRRRRYPYAESAVPAMLAALERARRRRRRRSGGAGGAAR
jgi:ankyrin repeat protein